MRSGRADATRGSAEWWFHPTSQAIDRSAMVEWGRRRADALRIAVGTVEGFEMEWAGGRRGGVVLRGAAAHDQSWIASCLTAAYPAGGWKWTVPPDSLARRPGRQWFGVPARPSSCSFPADIERPWADAILAALPLMPDGMGLRWQFRPAGLPSAPAEERPLEPQPPGLRSAPLTEPERLSRDRHERRQREPWWAVRVTLDFLPGPRSLHAASRFARAVSAASTRVGENRLTFVPPLLWLRVRPPAFFLSEGELLSLFPSPSARGPDRTADPAPGQGRGIVLGRTAGGAPMSISVPDVEGRHLAILGETGMGKSSALLRIAAGASRLGGVVLMDPVGDTAEAFLAGLPSESRERVVWISPTTSPVAIDLIGALRVGADGPDGSARALDDVVAALRRVRESRYRDTPFWGPRIEETVRRALAAAAALPDGGLADSVRLLAAIGQRPAGIPPEARSAVEDLWTRARDRPEEVEGSRRLLAELTDRPVLRRLLGDRAARFTPVEASAPGRILVISGEAHRVGESVARYLLAVHLALFWSARLSLARPPKCFLLLDEASWYAHDAVAEMLRLARRTNLHVVLASQSLESLPEDVAESVRTNVADFLLFRGSPAEAREFSRWLPSLEASELLGLSRGEAVLLRGKGSELVRGSIHPPRPVALEVAGPALDASRAASAAWTPSEELQGPDGPPEPVGTERLPRALTLVLWARALGVDGSTVDVSLRQLRTALGPDAEEVRTAGQVLRRLGILRSTERRADGTWWVVDRRALSQHLGPAVDPSELEAARRAWAALVPDVLPELPTKSS